MTNIKKEIKNIRNSCSIIKSKTAQLRLPTKPKYEEKPYDIMEREENLTPDTLEIQIKILQRMCEEVLKFTVTLNKNFERLIEIRKNLL